MTSLRSLLGTPLRWLRGAWRPDQEHRSLDETHGYWRAPDDGMNATERYFVHEDRSRFLLTLVRKHLGPDARILEIGCSVGRNLNHLFGEGYRDLVGIEISENAVTRMREVHPDLVAAATIVNSPVEEAIRGFADDEFDLVFTMAVLEHIHEDSEWIFAEMARIAKRLVITIEDEAGTSWRHFPRNYREIFEPLGLRQLESVNCSEAGLSLPKGFFAAVFTPATEGWPSPPSAPAR